MAEHTLKSVKYRFKKLSQLTERDPREGAKIVLKLLYLTLRRLLTKNQRALSNRENCRKWFMFDSGCTHCGSMPQNLLNIDLVIFFRRDPRARAKITLQKLLFITWRQILIQNQRALSNRQNWQIWLIFDSGCTDSQKIPQNLLNTNLPNLFDWLQETLVKKQKLFLKLQFLTWK